jgi:hypothetical protein
MLHNCLIFIILGMRDNGKHVKHQNGFLQMSLSLQRSKKHQTRPPGTNQGDFNLSNFKKGWEWRKKCSASHYKFLLHTEIVERQSPFVNSLFFYYIKVLILRSFTHWRYSRLSVCSLFCTGLRSISNCFRMKVRLLLSWEHLNACKCLGTKGFNESKMQVSNVLMCSCTEYTHSKTLIQQGSSGMLCYVKPCWINLKFRGLNSDVWTSCGRVVSHLYVYRSFYTPILFLTYQGTTYLHNFLVHRLQDQCVMLGGKDFTLTLWWLTGSVSGSWPSVDCIYSHFICSYNYLHLSLCI